ncbi:uncharacterized protein LOC131631796 [Vicia villosa]|uniref:uncharacterized protein LOC131631796 n=1 Tax=Vicia villosa TaxID=3911 RepID=UPI00273C4126|nr:uncharacterized protein LOC131631796 [Vicia villosa]
MDANVFVKISYSTKTKATWDIRVRCYGGDTSVKKVKLQSLRKQYENLNMENNEKVHEYISKVILITNEMKACGETLSKQVIIEKILTSLTLQLDYTVVPIEHSKDLSTMRIVELLSSLKAQEFRLTGRTSEREVEQALKASSDRKIQKPSWSYINKIHDVSQKSEASNSDEKKNQKGLDKLDKKKIQCYCCKNFGHYASECWSNKGKKSKEANIATKSDDEPMILMTFELDNSELSKWWYMDTGCSNHITENKQWLINFDSKKRTKIRCTGDNFLNAKGMGNARTKLKNGKTVLIKDVWYVPDMKSNLKMFGMFLVTMKDNLLKLYDSNQKMIMQSE